MTTPLWESFNGGDQEIYSSPGFSVCSTCTFRGADDGAGRQNNFNLEKNTQRLSDSF